MHGIWAAQSTGEQIDVCVGLSVFRLTLSFMVFVVLVNWTVYNLVELSEFFLTVAAMCMTKKVR